jgi:hypothetical protein
MLLLQVLNILLQCGNLKIEKKMEVKNQSNKKKYKV